MVEETEEYKLVVDRVAELDTRRKIDASYQNEYKKFVRYVIENNLREGPLKYIHRGSVDRYFEEAVVSRIFGRAGASRVVQSLQWFYSNLETPCGTLKIWSPVVKEAINKQQENRKNDPTATRRTCPHKGLKDLMTLADKKKIVTHVLRNRGDWGSINTSFCWGNQAATRGASTRKCGYSELYMSLGFGPGKEEGWRAFCLLVVLRAGEMNKDRFTSDRMVGCWRHREPLICAVGALALHMVNSLRLNENIHFRHDDPFEAADWWGTPLVDFETLNDETGPMKEVYKATGVEGCKLTHNRTYAVQQAGSEGLHPFQINSLTKHSVEKIHKCYMPELDKEACKVMAGFSKDEAYFVEREFLEPPWPIATLVNLLLPKYPQWVAQHESPEGDKSPCCRRFLYEVIPYMVRVVVQDSIYLIRDFPEHEMSNHLKVCNAWNVFLFKPLANSNLVLVQTQIFGHEAWAVTARQEAKVLLLSRREDEIKALNAAPQAAVATLHARELLGK